MTPEQMEELAVQDTNVVMEKHGEELCKKAFCIFEKTQSTRTVANKLGVRYSDAVSMITAYQKY